MRSSVISIASLLIAVPGSTLIPAGASAATVVPVAGVAAPQHQVRLSGTGVSTYPDQSSQIERYGITTTAATAGTVRIEASTSDPAGRVRVNGRTLIDGGRTLTGLVPGDEIAVFFEDAGGTARYSYIYLPAGFPELERTTADPTPGDLQPGHVLLTLSQWVRPSPPALDTYETAVDLNGVPVHAVRTDGSTDLTRQPDGSLTVFRNRNTPEGADLVVLDASFRPVGTRRAVGLYNTDGHDAILEPDGTTWFMSYEPHDPGSPGPIDSVVQRVDPDGTVGFQWSSAAFRPEAVRPEIDDYAHVNSMQVMRDGDLLVSFRNLSSVYKIATSAHDGFAAGEVVWKLGGRDSDFTFPAGDTGPCAQHTARELANGHILMFDNGSASLTTAWCVDQADPTGPPVQRVQTRVVEFALDEDAGTATVAKSHAPGESLSSRFFAIFAGSSQRLPNGNTMIGWASETKAVASEIGADGEVLWSLRDPRPKAEYPYFTYRAHKTEVPDVTAPEVDVTVPAQASTYVEGAVVSTDVGCSDRGGSSLQACDGPALLDTSTPGTRTAAFTARDGAGGVTTVYRTYTVSPATGVDAAVRARGTTAYVGAGVVGAAIDQQVRNSIGRPKGRTTATVRVTNTGSVATALTLDLTTTGKSFKVTPGRGVTTTPVLAPGESWELVLKAKRKPAARKRATALVTVTVTSTRSPARTDAVSWQVRATGGR